MRRETWSQEEFQVLNDKMTRVKLQNPKISPTEELRTLMRFYEKHLYGVSSRDLTLGKTVDFVENNDGTYTQIEADCQGYFERDGNDPSGPLTCHFEMSKFKEVDGKRLTYKEYLRDGKVIKSNRDEMIKLADAPQTTILDMGGAGSSLLETGVLTGFGTATGVVPPRWVNWLMELVSLKAFMKNFVTIQPMDEMQIMFPLKTSKLEDDSELQATALPTQEGRAGTEHAIVWANWQINGWKYLRYAELTNEVAEMLDKYLNVTSKYSEELAEGHALLWDYPINYGIQQMLVKGTWRYPQFTPPSTYAWEEGSGTAEPIPFGSASVLTTNAKKNYLFQDLSGGSDGTIYEPSVTTTEEFEYDSSTARAGSGAGDEIPEGLMALGSLLKEKGSQMDFVIFTDSRITERYFKDDRVQSLDYNLGDPKFQDERGYLGKVAIAGSSTFVDLWEAPPNLIPARDTDDTVADAAYPIFGGKYGEVWNHGVYSPISLRVDEGFEAKSDGVATRIRPTESKVLTTSSKGSSWPGDYHHVAILWAMLDDAHI